MLLVAESVSAIYMSSSYIPDFLVVAAGLCSYCAAHVAAYAVHCMQFLFSSLARLVFTPPKTHKQAPKGRTVEIGLFVLGPLKASLVIRRSLPC